MHRRNLSAVILAACAGSAYAQPSVWNFNGNLDAVRGSASLTFFRGDTAFGAFSTDTIDGQPTGVLNFVAATASQGLKLTHNIAGNANGGGDYVNQYTLAFDIKWAADGWSSFFQTNTNNNNDGDFFRNPSGGIGIAGQYAGSMPSGEWHRVVVAMDLTQSDPAARMRKYIDGVNVGTQTLDSGLDGRWSLDPFLLVLTDEDGDTMPGSISSLMFDSRAWCDQEIIDLGGPSAAGFLIPSTSPCSYGPSVTASFTPGEAFSGDRSLLTAIVTPGAGPVSSSYTVTADLTEFGGSDAQPLFDDGSHGDVTAGDHIYSIGITVPLTAAPGIYSSNVHVMDDVARESTDPASLLVRDAGSGGYVTQWDFDVPSNPLVSSFGVSTLAFWERPGGGSPPGSTQADTQFGTTSSFHIAPVGGVDAGVMRVPAYFGDEGLFLTTNLPGNGGGQYVNQYTLGYDLLVPSSDITDGFVAIPLFNTNCCNNNDADAYVDLTTNSIGFESVGYTAANALTLDEWHRIVCVVNTALDASPSHKLFIDGALAFSGTIADFEGRFPLYSTTEGDPNDGMHLFTEPTGNYTGVVFVNSIMLADRPFSDEEVGALSSPDADGIYPPAQGCAADFNNDGGVDGADVESFFLAWESAANNADVNQDGGIDGSDVEFFFTRWEAGGC